MKLIPIGAILAALCLPGAAFAADLPLKAPVTPKWIGAYPYDGTGFYLGLGTFGEAQKVTVNTPAVINAGTFAAGASVSGVAGYAYTLSPSRWLAVEVAVNYANTGANPSCGGVACSLNTRLSATQRLKYGGDMTMLTQWLPGLSSIPVAPLQPMPPGAVNPLSHPYAMLVAHEFRDEATMGLITDNKTRLTWGGGVGILTQLTNGSVIDTWGEATSSSGAHLMSANITERSGMQYRVGVTMLYGVTKN